MLSFRLVWCCDDKRRWWPKGQAQVSAGESPPLQLPHHPARSKPNPCSMNQGSWKLFTSEKSSFQLVMRHCRGSVLHHGGFVPWLVWTGCLGRGFFVCFGFNLRRKFKAGVQGLALIKLQFVTTLGLLLLEPFSAKYYTKQKLKASPPSKSLQSTSFIPKQTEPGVWARWEIQELWAHGSLWTAPAFIGGVQQRHKTNACKTRENLCSTSVKRVLLPRWTFLLMWSQDVL